jgi:Zn-dependent peptidase ImmA (M78 family)/transcriptional regulator with XRE-family HTH domain
MVFVTVRVDVRPELLTWARERSGLEVEELAGRFPKLGEWEQGLRAPTLKQLESFATATRTPVGFLFLAEPPEERVPIPDYRTIADAALTRPSPDLLDTIFQCQQRQDWYRDYAQLAGEDQVGFVGSLTVATAVVGAAAAMRETLGFAVRERGASWTEALRLLNDRAEDVGVLVMINGVVGSNTHRKLDPGEFRGFALVDRLAPIVFINGADTKAAQIFTLAHELAHVWLGQTALSSADLARTPSTNVERWCNQVAAEFLVPAAAITDDFQPDPPLIGELERLALRFKVSTLVVLRRIYDTGGMSWDNYQAAYQSELDRILELLGQRGTGGGGDFYRTQPVRVSKRFARAVITSTLEGQTLHRDAFQMLGFKKLSTFQELASRLGVT